MHQSSGELRFVLKAVDARIARVGLLLAADGTLTGAVDGQPRHVNEREAGLGQLNGRAA